MSFLCQRPTPDFPRGREMTNDECRLCWERIKGKAKMAVTWVQCRGIWQAKIKKAVTCSIK
ncbi:hypothetical protein CCP3SC15_380002 [Gammaproteobacteria bacterium]